MAQRGRFKQWSLDHKLAFWSIVVTAVAALATGVVVPVALAGGLGGTSVSVGANSGQINVGGTVVNNYAAGPSGGDPNPAGPTVQSNSCPEQTKAQTGATNTVTVDLFARPYKNGECWSTSVVVGLTPSTVEYEIRYENASNAVQKNVEFRVKLPSGLQMVPGTSYLRNSSNPNGVQLGTDAIATNGIVIGSYAPAAAGYVAFEVSTPAIDDLKCGSNVLTTVAYVQPESLDYFYNTADVDLTRACAASSVSG